MSQTHEFKAEVRQLLDLMIHAIYSNRDVFLRELVSNAADALDKVRFLALTRSDLAPPAHDEPGIRLLVDADTRTLVIEDDGIGMTEAEAIENLGTIAHSGTKAFLQHAQEAQKGDLPSLIGQFGVGFYSVFMVASEVTVTTRSAEPDAHGVQWVSRGDGAYTVERVDRDKRGTTLRITLREDAAEYADEARLRQIVQEHSNFLSWPILLGDDQINSGKAIWHLKPSEVTDAEANEFYRSLSFDWEDPVLRVHLQVDTPLQYAAMLFVPKNRPYDLFVPDADRGPRLYARRVLIAEHAKDLLPDWLRFVRGVVDSQDVPLNVSREMVQKTPVVRSIRDALIKRLLKELGRLAEQDAPEQGEHPYHAFWRSFGVLIKEGYFHDRAAYGDRLLPLLRFDSTASGDVAGFVSIADYKARMPEGQDAIWVLTAADRATALASPHLEAFRKKGYEVLLLTEPVDEWFLQSFTEAEGLPVRSATRGELDLGDDVDAADKADITGLGGWMKGLFGDAVASVRPSTRLTDSPAVLVDDVVGPSSNMERILRAANQDVGAARRHLELNVAHPLVKDLATLHEQGATDVAEPIARLLLDDAMLLEGAVKDATAVGRRLQALLERAAASAVAGR